MQDEWFWISMLFFEEVAKCFFFLLGTTNIEVSTVLLPPPYK
jgi:hypothetical protein